MMFHPPLGVSLHILIAIVEVQERGHTELYECFLRLPSWHFRHYQLRSRAQRQSERALQN